MSRKNPRPQPREEQLRQKSYEAIDRLLSLPSDDVEPLQFRVAAAQAKVGMQFVRELNTNARVGAGQMIRALSLVAESKDELRRLLKKSVPALLER